MKKHLNITGYKFVQLDRLPLLKEILKGHALRLELMGTILLSEEGINLMLAGGEKNVRDFVDILHQDDRLFDFEFKESYSEDVPFSRLKVKIKNEAIKMGVDGIDPLNEPAPYLPAKTLKKWYEEKRDMVIIDTRNTYEIEEGTFEGALDLKIENFRDFPDAIKSLPEDYKNKTIVTFCTGGIRCEKAAPLMQKAGFKDVYQLEGGIIKYFEECGGDHYVGDCFVFDERIKVNPNLEQTE